MKEIKKNKKKHSYSVTIFGFITLLVIMVYVHMLSDSQLFIEDERFTEAKQQVTDSKASFRGVDKILELMYGSGDNQQNGTGSVGSGVGDMWGNYPADYYAFMYAYETPNPLGLNTGDGGFGPYQATQPILPLILGIYEYDTNFFSWWKPVYDNPYSYCQRNGYATVGGSTAMRDLAKANLKTPDDYVMWYAACYSTAESWMSSAIKHAEDYLGKSHNELGHGTMAFTFAVQIRKNNNRPWKYCSSGMTEDQYIDALARGIAEESRNDPARWRCSPSLAKAMNAQGSLTEAGVSCDNTCGNGGHSVNKNTVLEVSRKYAEKNAGWTE